MKIFQFILLCTLYAISFPQTAQSSDAAQQTYEKKKLCLNMIVKNEQDVIVRCLTSVLPFIDYWVIVDTGSTDGTQQKIKNFMAQHNIPGELHERPWVNFQHNRQEALLLAKEKAEYLMFIDADDEITYPKDYELPDLIYDLYLLESQARNMRYTVIFMAKSDQELNWRYPIHEYLDAKDARVAGKLGSMKYIYHHDGCRSKDLNTGKSDIKILNECLEKEPDSPRIILFLAQTHRSINENTMALKYFQKRIEIGGNSEEVFWSMLQAAHIKRDLGYGPVQVEAAYTQAHEFMPHRPEPIFHLTSLAMSSGDFQKGYELAREGLTMPTPEDIFYIEEAACNGIIYAFAVCASELGKYNETLKACNKILKEGKLSNETLTVASQLRKLALEKRKANEIFKTLDKYYPQIAQ